MNINFKKFGDNDVKRLYENAKGNNKKAFMPFKKYTSDFGYDVVATSCKEIHPNVYEYGIGLGFQIDKESLYDEIKLALGLYDKDITTKPLEWIKDNIIFDIDLRPRSSVRDTGLILCNCEGTIDEGYINEVKATFYHVIPDLPIYKVGDKIGQIKIGLTIKCDFTLVDDFDDTERGLNGHGSTNK